MSANLIASSEKLGTLAGFLVVVNAARLIWVVPVMRLLHPNWYQNIEINLLLFNSNSHFQIVHKSKKYSIAYKPCNS